MTRQSFLYMAGGFGTVAAGRQYTPQFNMLAAIDPFGVGTIGDAFTGRGVYLAGLASGDVVRVDNLLAYISPSFGGLTVTAGYSMDAIGNEAVTARGADSSNAKLWAINPVYKNGPLYVSFNYHKAKVDSADFTNKVWDLGGTYDLGAVKLAGVYGKNKTNGGFNAKNWLLGVTAPMGSGALLASYARFKEDNAKASKVALGYEYNMSKRTNLYAVYAKISTNDAAEGNFSVRDWNADDYTSGINVGVRHKF
jgi:predicted porin